MADTKIRFTVEGVQTIESAINSILQKTEQMTDNIIAQGRIAEDDLRSQIELLKQRNELFSKRLGEGFTKNLKNINDIIREQIRLLNARNQAARGGFRNELEKQGGNSSDISSPDNPQGPPPVGGNTEIQMFESVVGIADSLEYLLSEGIRISPESIEALAELIKDIDPTGESRAAAGGDGGEGDSDDKSEFGGRFFGNLAYQTALKGVSTRDPMKGLMDVGSSVGGALMSTGNPYAIAGGAILSVLTGIFSNKLESASEVDPHAEAASRLFNTSWNQELSRTNAIGLDLGITRAESLQQQMDLQRATGALWNRDALKGNTRSSMEWQTRVGIDEGSIQKLATLLRSDRSERDINSLMGQIFFGQINAGVSQAQVTALLPELINNISSLATDFQNTTGNSNLDTILLLQNFLSNKEGFGDFFSRNPALMGSTMNAIMNGLTSASTPQAEALQYQTLARLNPGASFWQLRVARDNPSAEYAAGIFENLRAVSGYNGDVNNPARETYANTLATFFGVRPAVAEQLSKGEISEADFLKEAQKTSDPNYYAKSTEKIMTDLNENVSDLKSLITNWNDWFMGDNKAIAEIADFLNTKMQKIIEGREGRIERREKTKEMREERKKWRQSSEGQSVSVMPGALAFK